VIPARYASSRFPGKPLAPIRGVPLILRVHERVLSVFPNDRILIATDDHRIRDACESRGARVRMTPSSCLTGTDRVWEAVRDMEVSVILNVQGDEPLICAEDLVTVLMEKRKNSGQVVNAMCRISDPAEIESPHVPKVVVNERSELVYMSRAAVPYPKSSGVDLSRLYRRQVCIYGFRGDELKRFSEFGRKSGLEAPEDIEILRFLDLGIPVRMVEVRSGSVAVDVPEDVCRVERLMASAS